MKVVLKIYSVYDSATMAYLQPFYCRSHGEAIRSFTDAANTAEHNFHKHADDYILFHLGDFNDATGELIPLAERKSLGLASEYVSWKGTELRSMERSSENAEG